MNDGTTFTWRPAGGLLRKYLDVFEPTTDAPPQFHIFCCLTGIAAVLGRNVWLQDGAHRLHPNLFTLLLAPSSLYRKSTCVGIVQDVLRTLEGPSDRRHEGDAAPGNERILLPQQFTPESLLEILQQQPAGLLAIDEFRALLDGLRRDYNSGLRELLMTLYDCRGVHRKIRSAEFRVDEPCVSIVSACATKWFTEATKAGEIRSGFYARLCMVPAWAKDRHLARGAAADASGKRELIKRFVALRKVAGEITLPPGLERDFGDWALNQQRTIEGLEHEAELASFYTRLERVALKLAMLLQLALEPTSREIMPSALYNALTLVAWLQANLRRLFEDEFVFSRDMEDKQRLLRIIEKRPSIDRRELLRLSHLKVSNFDPLLNTLLQEGSIVQKKANGAAPGFYSASRPSQPVTPSVVTPQVTDREDLL